MGFHLSLLVEMLLTLSLFPIPQQRAPSLPSKRSKHAALSKTPYTSRMIDYNGQVVSVCLVLLTPRCHTLSYIYKSAIATHLVYTCAHGFSITRGQLIGFI